MDQIPDLVSAQKNNGSHNRSGSLGNSYNNNNDNSNDKNGNNRYPIGSENAIADSPAPTEDHFGSAESLWKMYHKAKASLPYKERIENLSWRMMAINLERVKRTKRALEGDNIAAADHSQHHHNTLGEDHMDMDIPMWDVDHDIQQPNHFNVSSGSLKNDTLFNSFIKTPILNGIDMDTSYSPFNESKNNNKTDEFDYISNLKKMTNEDTNKNANITRIERAKNSDGLLLNINTIHPESFPQNFRGMNSGNQHNNNITANNNHNFNMNGQSAQLAFESNMFLNNTHEKNAMRMAKSAHEEISLDHSNAFQFTLDPLAVEAPSGLLPNGSDNNTSHNDNRQDPMGNEEDIVGPSSILNGDMNSFQNTMASSLPEHINMGHQRKFLMQDQMNQNNRSDIFGQEPHSFSSHNSHQSSIVNITQPSFFNANGSSTEFQNNGPNRWNFPDDKRKINGVLQNGNELQHEYLINKGGSISQQQIDNIKNIFSFNPDPPSSSSNNLFESSDIGTPLTPSLNGTSAQGTITGSHNLMTSPSALSIHHPHTVPPKPISISGSATSNTINSNPSSFSKSVSSSVTTITNSLSEIPDPLSQSKKKSATSTKLSSNNTSKKKSKKGGNNNFNGSSNTRSTATDSNKNGLSSKNQKASNGSISGAGAAASAGTSGAAPQGPPTECTNCHTKTTPLWRRNPEGQPLCNACGLFLKLHGIVRPLSLKTDVIKKRHRGSGSSSKGAGSRRMSNTSNTGSNNNNNNNNNSGNSTNNSGDENNTDATVKNNSKLSKVKKEKSIGSNSNSSSNLFALTQNANYSLSKTNDNARNNGKNTNINGTSSKNSNDFAHMRSNSTTDLDILNKNLGNINTKDFINGKPHVVRTSPSGSALSALADTRANKVGVAGTTNVNVTRPVVQHSVSSFEIGNNVKAHDIQMRNTDSFENNVNDASAGGDFGEGQNNWEWLLKFR